MLPYEQLTIFPDYDVRYIAINDNVDTFKSENEMMIFRNVFNDFYARDTSKKVRAVLKTKGQSGKPLTTIPPYGYKKSENDKYMWVIDEETAPIVRRIYQLCIEGCGPSRIAKILANDKILKPTAYMDLKANGRVTVEKPYRWAQKTIVGIFEKAEYLGHTVNFKTHQKSYKCPKTIKNSKDDWVVFENTHEAIISQHDFDLVQELRKNKRKIQKCGEINPFSGMVYCADCGAKMYLCRSKCLTDEQEHLKCSAYAKDVNDCSAHYIRTSVLTKIVIDLLIGGSPCTYWSIAKHNRETDCGGEGFRLFMQYVRALDETGAKYFLYENNFSIHQNIKDEISRRLGVQPVMINSALVSAQQRKRCYWTNIPNVTQPADKGILLKDIIDNAVPWQGKSYCLTANYSGAYLKNTLERHQRTMVAVPVRIGDIGSNAQAHRVYSVHGKSISLSANSGGQGGGTGLYKIDLPDGDYIIRKLSPVECERLQTLPDNYTAGVSDRQRYRQLGNGWTVDVIAHILGGLI